MTKINNTRIIRLENEPTLSDFVVGSKKANGVTKNFSLQAILQLLNSTNGVNKIQFKFSDGSNQLVDQNTVGYFLTDTNETDPSGFTQLLFNKETVYPLDLSPLFEKLGVTDSVVLKLENPQDPNNFFNLKVVSFVDNTDYFVFGVQPFNDLYLGELINEQIYSLYFDVKSILDHNELDGLNVGDFQHLSQAEKDKLDYLDYTKDIDKPVSTAQAAADAATLVTAQNYAISLLTQLINGAPADGDTLKELNDKIIAIQAIIGSTPDGDSIVNTVTELLQVFATYPEGVNLVTLLAGKVNVTDIYNALDSIVAGKVLDARQGKVLKDLIDATYQPDTLISSVPPTRSVNTFTYPALGYSALITKTVRTNAAQFVTTVNAAVTADHKRVDLIYFKSDNTIDKIIGTESLNVAARPDVPANAVAISFINVFGNVVSDPTPVTNEISIQDALGVEKFKITDYLRFRGVSFNTAAKQLEIDALIPLSAFLDVVNGNDTLATLENASKPFKTLAKLISSLPAFNGETYNIYMTGGTIPVTRRLPSRNLNFISYTLATLDFTNCMLNDGITHAPGVIDAPYTSSTWTFINNNISIYCGYYGEKCFGSNAGSTGINNVIIKGNIDKLDWRSFCNPSYFGAFIIGGSSDFIINTVYDITISGFNRNTLSNKIRSLGIGNLRVKNYITEQFTAIVNSESYFNLVVDKVTQQGSVTWPSSTYLGLGPEIGDVIVGDVIFNVPNIFVAISNVITFKGTINSNVTIDFSRCVVVSGTIISSTYSFCSFQDRQITFNSFTGKIGTIDYFGNVGKYVNFENCNIEAAGRLLRNATSFNDANTLVRLKGFNTIRQIDTTKALFHARYDDVALNTIINIEDSGTLKTNALTLGPRVNISYLTSTFKEKINEVVIRSKTDLINKVLSSSTTYIIDGIITLLTGEYIQVPAGGLTIVGYGFDVSRIEKNVSGESIFSSPAGNSGNFVSNNMQYNSGAGSVFNITDSDGSHAIEVNDVNFQSCSSLGTLTGYRQFTGTTCGIYGCSDGITLEGTWNGFKLVNTNAFGFGAAGTLIKKGTTTSFNNRLYLDVNLSLPTGAKICDFQSSNFASNKLLQVVNCLVKVNGIIDPNTTSATFPNITPFDPKSYFTNNIGLKNTFLEPYGLKNTNLSTYANNAAAATGGILIGEVYVETSTGYFKTRLT